MCVNVPCMCGLQLCGVQDRCHSLRQRGITITTQTIRVHEAYTRALLDHNIRSCSYSCSRNNSSRPQMDRWRGQIRRFRPQSRGPHQWWMITENGKVAYMHYMERRKQAERDKKAGAGWKWQGGKWEKWAGGVSITVTNIWKNVNPVRNKKMGGWEMNNRDRYMKI